MASRGLLLFEDEHAARFEPVALTRAVAQLRVGAWTFRERWERWFPDRIPGVIVRAPLVDRERATHEWQHVNEAPAGDGLFVAASATGAQGHLEAVRGLEPGQALVCGDRLLAARTDGDATSRLAAALVELAGSALLEPRREDPVRFAESNGLAVRDVPGRIAGHLVNLTQENEAAIAEDFHTYESLIAPPVAREFPGVHFLEPSRIRLAEGVRVDPGCVLDAREGPILIGPASEIHANSVITGPVVAGATCRVRALTRLGGGVSLGPLCRVGGEIHHTVMQGHANKQHDGFLGHSYLGSWVNLGAATDTSDLRNDYGLVRIEIAGEALDTGTRSVGSLIGDHTKTAIHTRLNTGTVLGVSCNVFGSGFPPRAVPSYSWGGGQEWVEYRVDKAIEVARRVMSRRKLELGEAEETLLRRVHAETAGARRRA